VNAAHRARWRLCQLDDDSNVLDVACYADQAQSETACAGCEATGHKQTNRAESVEERGGDPAASDPDQR